MSIVVGMSHEAVTSGGINLLWDPSSRSVHTWAKRGESME